VLNLNFIHSTQRYTFTPFVRYLDICIGTYLVYDDEVTDHNSPTFNLNSYSNSPFSIHYYIYLLYFA
jgi:hypothetical protein